MMVTAAAAELGTHPGRSSSKHRQRLPVLASQNAAHTITPPCSSASPAINTALMTGNTANCCQAGSHHHPSTSGPRRACRYQQFSPRLGWVLEPSPWRNCNKKGNFPVKCDLWLPILPPRAPDARSCPVTSSPYKQVPWDTNCRASADPIDAEEETTVYL